MNAKLPVAWCVCLVVVVAAATPTLLRYRHAMKAVHDARATGASAGRMQTEVATAVRSLPAWAVADSHASVDQALAQTFANSVTASGLPSTAVESFTPTPRTAIDVAPGLKNGPAITRDRASAVLTGVALPQLGRFLETWRTSAPAWTVTQIDLSPVRLSPTDAARYAGSDLPLRVSLSVERLAATGISTLVSDLDLPKSADSKDAPR